jgi:sugar phosphate isomerase/epimerase
MATEGIRLGCVASALAGDIRQAPRIAREMGFAGLEVDTDSASLDLSTLSGSGRREVLRLLSSQDQQLIALRTDLGAKGFGPGADVDRQLSQLERAMEAAAGLSAPVVCVDIGPLPRVVAKTPPKPKVRPEHAGLILLPETGAQPTEPEPQAPPPDPEFVSQVNAAMVELGRRADRYSVILAFRTDLASFASFHETIRQANCPWFGVDLDPVAVLRDSWDMDEVFSTVGPRVRHVRGRDAIAGADHRTKPAILGKGSVDWPTIISNLDQAGYQGWVAIDPVDLTDRTAAAMAGLKYLRSLVS